MAKQRFMNEKKSFPLESGEALSESMIFIEDALRRLGVESKLVMRTLLLTEEMLAQFIEKAAPGSSVRVQVRRFLGDASISLRLPGEQFDPYETTGVGADALDELEDEEAQRAVRSILLKSQGEKLKYSHKDGVNQALILTGESEKSGLKLTLAALVLGLLMGAVMRGVMSEAVSDGLDTFLLTPVKTMFMNALKIVIGPVVFFSIVSCIAQFKDLAELGRIALKIMGLYMLTTVIAVFLAMGFSTLIHPGTPGFALTMAAGGEAVSVDTSVDTSLLSTIVNIVPSNPVKPFLESNTLQIIFLGVLCGAAVGMIGKYTSILQEFFEACNALFLTMTTMIARLIPLAVFCSTALMMKKMGGASMMSVLGCTGTVFLTGSCMTLTYGLLVLLLGRLNPLTFFRKNREGMITSFTLSSSSAAMPVNMKTCTDKLGISSKVCSFSIPLGATVNMDGTSIALTVIGLFMARAYAVPVPQSAYVSLAITIILLSMGCPGVPGSGLICLGVVLEALGVPIEAIGLIMGVYPLIDMFNTLSNTTGDVAATLIVSKSEGLVDLKKYNE